MSKLSKIIGKKTKEIMEQPLEPVPEEPKEEKRFVEVKVFTSKVADVEGKLQSQIASLERKVEAQQKYLVSQIPGFISKTIHEMIRQEAYKSGFEDGARCIVITTENYWMKQQGLESRDELGRVGSEPLAWRLALLDNARKKIEVPYARYLSPE